jgi:hypothetical protein
MKQMSQMRNILQQSLTFRNGDLERDMPQKGPPDVRSLRWKGFKGKLVYSSMRVGA